jgi:hypothetical protein
VSGTPVEAIVLRGLAVNLEGDRVEAGRRAGHGRPDVHGQAVDDDAAGADVGLVSRWVTVTMSSGMDTSVRASRLPGGYVGRCSMKRASSFMCSSKNTKTGIER